MLHTIMRDAHPTRGAAVAAALRTWADGRRPRIQLAMDDNIKTYNLAKANTRLKWQAMQCFGPCLVRVFAKKSLLWGNSFDGLPWEQLQQLASSLPPLAAEAAAFREGGLAAMLGGAGNLSGGTAATTLRGADAARGDGRDERAAADRSAHTRGRRRSSLRRRP